MAVCDPVTGMHSMFAGLLPEHVFAERPPDGFDAALDQGWASHVRELAATHADELAGVIVEPVVQGAGGMRFHSPACVALMREICDEHGLLLVLDEIATGFGRTRDDVRVRARRREPRRDVRRQGADRRLHDARRDALHAAVADAVSCGEGGGLMHGPTFMANPLACAVALASLEVLDDGRWHGQVAAIAAGAARRARARPASCRVWPTCACSARSA